MNEYPRANSLPWSGRSAGAGASSSRFAARSGSSLAGLLAILAIAYALERSSSRPPRSSGSASSPALRARGRRRVVLRAAAVAQGHRRTGRALSRRARALARFHDPQRDGSAASGRAVVAGADRSGWSRTAIERVHEIQEGERIEREPMRRYAWVAGAVSRWPHRAVHVRPGVSPSHAVGDLRHLARRRSRGAVSDRGEARQRDRAKGADQMISATLSGFDAADAAILIRKGSASAFERVPMVKAENGTYEGHAVRSRRAARLRRRSGRRALPRRTS